MFYIFLLNQNIIKEWINEIIKKLKFQAIINNKEYK